MQPNIVVSLTSAFSALMNGSIVNGERRYLTLIHYCLFTLHLTYCTIPQSVAPLYFLEHFPFQDKQ